MKAAVNLLWAMLSVLGAVALAHIVGVINPHEKVNGLWLVVAAACIYVLAIASMAGGWITNRGLPGISDDWSMTRKRKILTSSCLDG